MQGFWGGIHTIKPSRKEPGREMTHALSYVFDSAPHSADSDAYVKACDISLAVVICGMVLFEGGTRGKGARGEGQGGWQHQQRSSLCMPLIYI